MKVAIFFHVNISEHKMQKVCASIPWLVVLQMNEQVTRTVVLTVIVLPKVRVNPVNIH